MPDFDPSAYADAVESAPAFDPKAYADAVDVTHPSPKAKRAAIGKQGAAEMAAAQSEQPTLDAANTGAFHFARQLSGGLGDKIIAAEQATGDWLHDKTGRVKWSDAYARDLSGNDKLLEASDAAHPIARWVGNAGGFAGNLAALAAAAPARAAGAAVPTLAQLAGQGAKIGSVLGAVGGFGGSRAGSALGTAADTGLGGAVGGTIGAVTPYAANLLGRGATAAGGKLRDLAGWLKINSIHPTPALGEALEAVPGGKVAAGKELLERGVGGLTKEGTAKQAEAELSKAGSAIGAIAQAHDAAGGAQVDLRPALSAGMAEAQRLQAMPFASAKSAGKQLEAIVSDYATKIPGGQAPATAALAIKRELQHEAFGAGEMLKKSGDQLSGHYAKGVAGLAADVDKSMDSAIGPQFEAANLSFRRLLGASNAADRQASRASANHLVGLLPAVVGSGELAGEGGAKKAGAAMLAVALANKYGSQAGARLLHSPIGGGLGLLGRGLQAFPSGALGSAAAAVAPTLADLLSPRSSRDDRRQTIGQLLSGGSP